jgi:triphosphatase
MSQSPEIELKLDVPANRVARLRGLPPLRGAAPVAASTLRSTYFDTDKRKLRNKGLSLRVRQSNGRHVQTIKQQRGRSVGLFERNEWEQEIAGQQPDLDAARGTALEPLLGKKLRRRLKPIFETRVRRTAYPIRRNGSEVKLTVDRGTVEAAGRTLPLCEIELELKQGAPAELFELARDLGKAVPIQPASKSKAAQGYELLGKEEPGPVESEPIPLSPRDDWAMAFKVIARACLYQIVANEAALRRFDAEGVHQMRVGVRRVRTAMSLFSDMLAGAQTETIKTELKWITEQLGPARELDVFMRRVIKRARGHATSKSGIGLLAEDFQKKRIGAFAKAKSAIDSARFRQLVLDAAAWIEVGDWTRKADDAFSSLRERPVREAAIAELRRRTKKIRRQGAELTALDPRRRHKLRINAKKLRYATEFFAAAFPGKKSERRRKKFAARLKKLQSVLGDLNDIVVHEGLAKQTIATRATDAKRRPAGRAFAAGRLSGREEARFASTMKDAERAHAAFVKTPPFWE